MKITQILFTIFVIVLTAFSASAMTDFELRVAVEDRSLASPGNPFYIDAMIRVSAQNPTTLATIYDQTKNVVTTSNTFEDSYNYFEHVPAESIVTIDPTKADYYTSGNSGNDQIYIPAELDAAYENMISAYSAGNSVPVWYNDDSVANTECEVTGDLNRPYLDCSMTPDGHPEFSAEYLFAHKIINGVYTYVVFISNKIDPIPDKDGDGFNEIEDCDDNDNTVYPGAPEICDGKKNNCDAVTYIDGSDETAPLNPVQQGVCIGSTQVCVSGTWTPLYTGILNYENPENTCDNLDNDCDGTIDETCGPANTISFDAEISPKFPTQNDDLTCKFTIEDTLAIANNDDLTVLAEINNAGNIIPISFACTNGNCIQDLILPSSQTTEETTVSCSARYYYDGAWQYSNTASTYIYKYTDKDDDDDDNDNINEPFVQRSRFVGGDSGNIGDELELAVRIDGNDIRNTQLRVQVFIMGWNDGFDKFMLGPFDFKKGDIYDNTLRIKIPEGTPSGSYYARIVITDGNFRYVKHRILFVE